MFAADLDGDGDTDVLSGTWVPGSINWYEYRVGAGSFAPPRVVAAQPNRESDAASYQAAVNAYRRELIVTALARTGGNRAAAATALGLHRTHLLRLIRALAID